MKIEGQCNRSIVDLTQRLRYMYACWWHTGLSPSSAFCTAHNPTVEYGAARHMQTPAKVLLSVLSRAKGGTKGGTRRL